MKLKTGLYQQYKGLTKSAYIIFIGRLITNMGAFIWPLLTLILSKKIGYSATTIAWMTMGIMLLFIPANILGGVLADKFNKKKIIIMFDIVSVIFFISCSIIEPGTLMVVFFVLAGLFANMEGPAYDALVAEATKPKEREKVYSLMYLGHNLGFMFGAAIGGFLFEKYLNLAFLIDGITTITSTVLIVLFVKILDVSKLEEAERNEYEEGHHKQKSPLKILFERKSIFVQMIGFMLASMIYDQWSFVLPLYMVDIFGEGLGASRFGLIGSFNAFIVITFTAIMTKVLEKTNEIPKIIIGVFLFSISYIIIMNFPPFFVFFIMMFLFTLGEIINMLGSSPYLSRRVPDSHRGRINSIRGIMYMVGAIISRLAMGYIIDNTSYNTAFIVLAGIGIVATVLSAFNYKLDKKLFPKLYTGKKLSEQ